MLVCLSAAAVVAQQIGLYGPAGPVQPGWLPAADKVQHALGFALPMFLLLTTLETYTARAGRTTRPPVDSVIAGLFTLNAVVSECYQAHPGSGRSGDPLDVLADLVGVALGWLAFRVLRERWRGRGGRPGRGL